MKTTCIVSTITIHLYIDEVQEDEMGGACVVYGGEEMCIQGFGGGRYLHKRSSLEILRIG